jgi:MtrB/PioB family decaheme-associated outer membrane protein
MNRLGTFKLSGVALALAAAFGPARAVEPIVTQNIDPAAPAALNTGASTASVGVGYASDDARRFGQYNGINQDGFYGLIDFNWVKRNDETGTWTRAFGRDVGLDDRQLRFEQQRQGNWGYSIDYSRIPRFEPLIANTSVVGIGSNTLVMPATPVRGGSGSIELGTKRDTLGLGFDKYFAGNWDVQVKFRNEQKDGTRIFARGTTGTGTFGGCACEFAPEPIDATTRQLEAKVNYNGGALLLTGGYYGTMYNNNFDSGLNFVGGNSSLASFTPIGLPPDNQSHQLYVSGNYAFSQTTRSTFKLAWGKITQDAQFIVPTAAALPDNLGGRIDTKLAQFGVTARPMPKLSVYGDVRVEDRDDKTPVHDYFTNTTSSTSNGENEPRSIRTTAAKAEANYALPEGFRIIGGVGYEEKKRNFSAVRVVSAREVTDERSYRVELRRPMAETLIGSVALIHSDRDGSPFLTTTQTSGAVGSNLIAPVFLADRKRDKVRVTANWAPIAPLNVQFFVDSARDDYSGRDGSALGPRKGEAQNYSLDASYVFNDRWQANTWYSRNDTLFDQATCEAASSAGVCPGSTADPTWSARLRNLSNNIGAGLRAKPSGQIDLGAEVTYSEIRDKFDMGTIQGGAVTSLPEVTTKLTRLNLYARYALQKSSGVRLDYIYDRFSSDDWTWAGTGGVPFTYTDGTTLTENRPQTINFIGVSYYYKFQ